MPAAPRHNAPPPHSPVPSRRRAAVNRAATDHPTAPERTPTNHAGPVTGPSGTPAAPPTVPLAAGAGDPAAEKAPPRPRRTVPAPTARPVGVALPVTVVEPVSVVEP